MGYHLPSYKVNRAIDLFKQGKSIRAVADEAGIAKGSAETIRKKLTTGGVIMAVEIYTDEKSPCIECEHRARDKNDPECTSCERRLRYLSPAPRLKLKTVPVVTKTVADIPETPQAPETKICRGPLCKEINLNGVEKPISEFGKRKYTKDGLQRYCKKCCTYVVQKAKKKNDIIKSEIEPSKEAVPIDIEQIIADLTKVRDTHVKSLRKLNRAISILKT